MISWDVIDTVKKSLDRFPAGLHAGMRYMRAFPDTQANREFNDNHVKRFGAPPLSWTWSTYTGALLLGEAVKKANTTETEAVVKALGDLTVKDPIGMGPNGAVTMRGRDNQLLYYAVGWGETIPQDPYLKDIFGPNWNEMLAEETEWLKSRGWL